jgi:hypothetical protein
MFAYGRRLKRLTPNWSKVPSSKVRKQLGLSSPREKILIATSTGGHLSAMTMDTLLTAALQQRGAEVQALLCDAALPACMLAEKHILPDEERFLAEGPRPMCRHCFAAGTRAYEALGVRIRRLSEFLTTEDRGLAAEFAARTDAESIQSVTFDGMAVGQQALAGALRYYAVGDLQREALGDAVLRRYLEGAVLTAIAGRRLMAEGFTATVLHHAIYVPQGVLAQAARNAGSRVVAWNTAYRTGRFIFTHGETYHYALMRDDKSNWADAPFSLRQRQAVSHYLASRRGGGNDWISYQRSLSAATATELGLDSNRPIISLMTNVIWDAQLYYAANAYSTMKDWVLDTIAWFQNRPDLQLVVRIHPAEILNPLAARQLMLDEIRRCYPSLPDNVKIVPPDDPLNTYALADLSDTILIYGTKMGVELAAAGKPVIVAGEAWIRNKGIAYEASTAAEYHALLSRLPFGAVHDQGMSERALRYAYHFFFRCMIPVSSTEARQGWPPYKLRVASRDALEKDLGLNLICDGILYGTPFLWDDGDADVRTRKTAA